MNPKMVLKNKNLLDFYSIAETLWTQKISDGIPVKVLGHSGHYNVKNFNHG